MKSQRNIWIVLGISMLLFMSGCTIFYIVPKHSANQAIDNYMQTQKIADKQIASKSLKKDWKGGGYVATFQFKDDKQMTYEYHYDQRFSSHPNNIFLLIFKDGSGQDNKNVKHPPLK